MRYTMILIVLSGGLLAGCTPFLEDLNANLKSVNANLKNVNTGLRGGAGSPSTTLADSDADVCDPVAFKAGFEDQYVANWNHTVIDREGFYRYLSQQRPNAAAARHNYDLYRGKRLSSKGIGRQMEYGVEFNNKGRILNYCQSNSYMKGERAGIQAAGRDLKVLADQEIEMARL